MKREKSCGAVIYRKQEGKLQVLLIKHKNGGHWAFPKGHVERNETEAQTALREIREETGLQVNLDTRFRKVVTYSPKVDRMKDVIYFAAEFCGGAPQAQPEEVMDIRWVELTKALKDVTYQNDKEVLRAFILYIKTVSE